MIRLIRGEAIITLCPPVFVTVDNFSVKTKGIAATSEQTTVLITALNHQIGYDKGARVAKQALKQQRSILDVGGEVADLERDELADLLNPNKLVHPKRLKEDQ